MDTRSLANYLEYLGSLLKEKALEAKAEADRNREPYEIGRLMAFHEVISLMQSQAVLFDLDFLDIGLADIDPERDLL